MSDPIYLGLGLAPAVTIVDGLVYVAFGVQPNALVLVVLTPTGTVVRREVIGAGFFNSFPRFSGPWLVYKRDHDWRAAALHVQTGQSWIFRGQADGNFGVVVNADLNLVAYQWTASYQIWLGSLVDGEDAPTPMRGAPDGLDTLVSPSQVTLRKDTRLAVLGMFYPVRAGDLTVGERPDGGIAVQLDGAGLRVALGGQDTPTPSCATNGETYAIVTGGPQGVRILLGSRAALLGLSLAAEASQPAPDLPAPVPEPPAPLPPPPNPVPPHHPGPSPAPPKERPMKNKDQVRADINELIRFYQEPDGLNRAARGIPPPVVFNDPAITDWFTLAVMQPVEDIKRQIRTFPEWKHQHAAEAPHPDPQ